LEHPYDNFSTHLIQFTCLWHFILSPFFLVIGDYRRYLISYLSFCGLVAIVEIGCLLTLPSDLGFGGMAYLYFPVISVLIGGLSFFVKTVGHSIRSAKKLKQERELQQREGISAQGDIAGPWPPQPMYIPPRPGGPPPPPTPRQLWKDALRDGILIVVVGLAMPIAAFRQYSALTGETLEPNLGRFLSRILIVEAVWQVWARYLSPRTSLLRQQPRTHHVAVIGAATLLSIVLEFMAPTLTGY